MPNQNYTINMARYNHWQNDSLLKAANGLTVEERARDRGAFFSSIEETFAHLLWADRIWMSRFAGTETPLGGLPNSMEPVGTWDEFCLQRRQFDDRILQWGHEVSPDWFDGDLTWYSGAIGRELSRPKDMLVTHFFNHQTHHRGQIHAMLTSAGAAPDDTDIPLMPVEYRDL